MRPRLAVDEAEQDVVTPGAVDLEIAARIALARETIAQQNGDRRRVVGNAGRLHPMQAELAEREIDRRGDGARHASLAGVLRPHPVAERSGLRNAPAQAAERHPAQKLVRESGRRSAADRPRPARCPLPGA